MLKNTVFQIVLIEQLGNELFQNSIAFETIEPTFKHKQFGNLRILGQQAIF